jgi:tRNA(Arg) A34 adenosine deaminase TadA
MPLPEPAVLADRFLDVIEHNIVPKTRAGVASGNKLFGAAILRKDDLSLVIAGTNAETENPLFHGEISTLNAFYRLPSDRRPATRDCLFLSTHEPCSLCLSAITWAGFDNFFYLFGYEDTRDAFNIPHDLKILQQVFKIEQGDYARENAFWTSRAIADLAADAPEADRRGLTARMEALSKTYAGLSAAYQAQKGKADIPLD